MVNIRIVGMYILEKYGADVYEAYPRFGMRRHIKWRERICFL
jgi:hypothetical protein